MEGIAKWLAEGKAPGRNPIGLTQPARHASDRGTKQADVVFGDITREERKDRHVPQRYGNRSVFMMTCST